MQPTQTWQSYLPLIVIVVVFALRARTMNRHQRMHLGRLAVAPVIVALLAIWLVVTSPPDLAGLGAALAGIALGALLGWQRARLVAIAYDPASDTFTMKQSPFALIVLLAIIVARRMIMHATVGGEPGAAAMAPQAMETIDGLIGFALAMVATRNGELWLRARKLRTESLQSSEP
jgi:hypothetical protein